jgi:hypothetical protein
MIPRRGFLKTAGAFLLSLCGISAASPLSAVEDQPKELRTILRWTGKEWEQIRLMAIKAGDLIRMIDSDRPGWCNYVGVAVLDAYYGQWTSSRVPEPTVMLHHQLYLDINEHTPDEWRRLLS